MSTQIAKAEIFIKDILRESGDDHDKFTPFHLCEQMLAKLSSISGAILVVANLEFLYTAVRQGIDCSRLFFATPNNMKAQAAEQMHIAGVYKYNRIITSQDTHDMKFDAVIMNPPYHGRGQLYQQFFNCGVDLLRPGGSIVALHPSTVYYTNKGNKGHTARMRANVSTYQTTIEFRNPRNIWKTSKAEFGTDVAITLMQKIDNDTAGLIKKITYTNGQSYENCSFESISMTNINPTAMESIYHKYMNYVNEHGSLLDVRSYDPDEYKAGLPKICGNQGMRNFYSFFSPTVEYPTTASFGIVVDNEEQRRNVYQYMRTNFARFALALYKCTSNLNSGELGSVPLMDFSIEYDDESLFNLLGITDEEQSIIADFLSNYNHT